MMSEAGDCYPSLSENTVNNERQEQTSERKKYKCDLLSVVSKRKVVSSV